MISITNRPWLFVDEDIVDRHAGTRLRLHEPRRENVCLVFDKPWEGPGSNYCTVLDTGDISDGVGGSRYRLYYRGAHYPDFVHAAHPDVCCLAESDDGIVWRRRLIWRTEFAGSHANNIVWDGFDLPRDTGHNFAPCIDLNPDAAPDARFKAVAGCGALFALKSPDGIAWSLMSPEPVITEGAFDSLNVPFWDAARGDYACYFRIFVDGVRHIAVTRSDDFVTWREPEPLDFGDAPPEHLYTNAVTPYPRDPELLLSFPMRLMPDRQRHLWHGQAGVSDALFVASRDGRAFHQFRDGFIRPGLDALNWTERNFIVAPGLLRTSPTEYSLYWVDHLRHSDTRLTRGTVRVDGFASLHADASGGEMTSKAVRLESPRLALNMSTSAAGSVSVALLEADGSEISGFGHDDCDVLYGDDLERAVTWGGGDDLARLRGGTIRLSLRLNDADVYSIMA